MLQIAMTCFLISSHMAMDSNGAHNVCVYQCGGERYSMMVSAGQMCPMQTEAKHNDFFGLPKREARLGATWK
jgi:hypothetical protein